MIEIRETVQDIVVPVYVQGELPLATVLYAQLTGVRSRLAVARTVRLLVRDKSAARASAAQLLRWPIQRVVVAHNAVIETDAHAQLARALQVFGP